MRILLAFLLMISLGASAQGTRHIYTGTNNVLKLAKPGYQALGKYNTYFAVETTIAPGDTIDVRGTFEGIETFGYGDTTLGRIVIMSGTSAWIRKGIKGYDMNNILITGRPSGDVSNTIDTTGSMNTYNLVFGDSTLRDAAIDFLGRMSHITIDRIKCVGNTYGVRLKTDPPSIPFYGFCDVNYTHDTTNVNNHYIDSITVTNSYFANIMADILYLGNTDPYAARPNDCGGVDSVYYTPMRMRNVTVNYNGLYNAGRTGIMVSGADKGRQLVHDNWIRHMGDELNQSQGTGVSIGGATKNCWVYNNHIRVTFLYGIFDLGFGVNYIQNNYVDSSGYLNRYVSSGVWGVYYPYINKDSVIDANSPPADITDPEFNREGDWVVNKRYIVSILSRPPSAAGYPKTVVIRNNVVGKTGYDVTPTGAIVFRQDDGLNANWTTSSVVCGNTEKDLTAADVYQYTAEAVTYAQYSTDCGAPLPENPPDSPIGPDPEIIPRVLKDRSKRVVPIMVN